VNCDRVALSRFSVQLGLPIAVWGVLGYALMAGLAASGVARRRPGSTWPAGLLLLVSVSAAVASVALAVVSKVAIGAWCPLCVVSWLISFGLVAAAWRASRGPGAGGAIREDLAALCARPLRAGAVVLLLLGGVVLTSAAYPRYWERGSASVRKAPSEATGPAAATASAGPLLVFEYTDYECPFCARMHEETRALAHRPDVTLVRRHFPLDPACNPAVKRQVHPSACTLARAGICAEAQGRIAEMEDALFANQRDRAPVEALASRLRLDLERFRACLSSPETERRLAADVAAGVQDGVRATPSYVVGGTVHAGRLPPELLRAIGATHGG
jgi:protein-disulfide isomerase